MGILSSISKACHSVADGVSKALHGGNNSDNSTSSGSSVSSPSSESSSSSSKSKSTDYHEDNLGNYLSTGKLPEELDKKSYTLEESKQLTAYFFGHEDKVEDSGESKTSSGKSKSSNTVETAKSSTNSWFSNFLSGFNSLFSFISSPVSYSGYSSFNFFDTGNSSSTKTNTSGFFDFIW